MKHQTRGWNLSSRISQSVSVVFFVEGPASNRLVVRDDSREKHQATFGQVIVRAWRPRVFRWMVHAIRAGAIKAKPATRTQAWSTETLKNLPGKPEAVLLPGHTPGNAAIVLPDAGAIAVGDSFVAGHPLNLKEGPQLLHPMYHTNPAEALAATRRLAGIDASVVLPGHGSALRMSLADALAALRS